MRVVIGRDNRRQVYEVPCASVLARANPVQVQEVINNICSQLGLLR